MTDPAILESVIGRVIANVIQREGGIVTFASEGYETRWGQTPDWLRRWRLPFPKSKDEAAMNYRSWIEQCNLDALCTVDDPLADLVIDFAVHSGERVAIAALQRAIGIKADGVLGPKTAMALQHANRFTLALHVVADRVWMQMGLVGDHPEDFAKYSKGWGVRIAAQIRSLA